MAYNNTVILTGNMGGEVRINKGTGGKTFASLQS